MPCTKELANSVLLRGLVWGAGDELVGEAALISLKTSFSQGWQNQCMLSTSPIMSKISSDISQHLEQYHREQHSHCNTSVCSMQYDPRVCNMDHTATRVCSMVHICGAIYTQPKPLHCYHYIVVLYNELNLISLTAGATGIYFTYKHVDRDIS